MSFTSFNFLAFLFVVVAVYYLVPKKLQWLVLLIASYGFYLSTGTENVAYILFTTLFTYGGGLLMQKLRDDNQAAIKALGDDVTKEQKREMKKAVAKKVRTIQVATVAVNLGVLIFIKASGFFVTNLNGIFGLFHWDVTVPMVNVIAPPGPFLLYLQFHRLSGGRGPR